jgi:1A family penicillin-binding protein
MDTLLVKIFATALTLSQVTTAPDTLAPQFDRDADQGKVVSLLREGCRHVRKVLEIDDLNLDDLISTAMQDPDLATDAKASLLGIKVADLQSAYRQLCTDELVPDWGFDAGAVIDFYNKTLAGLPDPTQLKNFVLPGATIMLDRQGNRFKEVGDQRRISISLAEIPDYVQKAFVSAEDKRFYEHAGIDERGLIRAVLADMAKSGRPEGASTISQQVVKNLLVGNEVSYERKMREIVLTSRLEQVLSKNEILQLYLNTIYLGRSSWGIEMAARSYFGKSAKDLTLAEGALLASLPKGPSYFSPDRYPERIRERRAYVLTRMQEDGVITAEQAAEAKATTPAVVPFEKPQRNFGFHFADQAMREARTLAAANGLSSSAFVVRTTIDTQLQRNAEDALQEGLWRYEHNFDRVRFRGSETNLGADIARIEANAKPGASDQRPAWQRALVDARLPLYDVHWTPAVVLETRGKRADLQVGLADGRVLPLSGDTSAVRRSIKPQDVVFVRLSETKGDSKRASTHAELRVRPQVQGAVVVMENATGRILAMAGGFSYPLSQFDRAMQAERQPGSAIKPLSYLAALENGLQPNTLIRDEPVTFAPIGGGSGDGWSPKNYEGGSRGVITLRQALENSRNLATVHLLEGGIEAKPEQSLDRLCTLALQLKIYRDCVRYYPFVLGAEPVRPVDLAAFYAAIANEGMRPSPHTVESIEQDGASYQRKSPQPQPQAASPKDRAAFYQLKTMLQGVVQRGTARAMAALAPYVAGKTGTTEDENDTWFVGFTNDITIAVWVGYDNAGSGHRTLGEGATGASVAAPIFRSIIEAAWKEGYPKTPLAAPSSVAQAELSCSGFDPESGEGRGRHGSTECLRLDAKGRAIDARYRLVSRDSGDGGVSSVTRRRGGGGEPPPAAPAWGQQQWRQPDGFDAYGRAGGWFGGFGGARPRGFWNW